MVRLRRLGHSALVLVSPCSSSTFLSEEQSSEHHEHHRYHHRPWLGGAGNRLLLCERPPGRPRGRIRRARGRGGSGGSGAERGGSDRRRRRRWSSRRRRAGSRRWRTRAGWRGRRGWWRRTERRRRRRRRRGGWWITFAVGDAVDGTGVVVRDEQRAVRKLQHIHRPPVRRLSLQPAVRKRGSRGDRAVGVRVHHAHAIPAAGVGSVKDRENDHQLSFLSLRFLSRGCMVKPDRRRGGRTRFSPRGSMSHAPPRTPRCYTR